MNMFYTLQAPSIEELEKEGFEYINNEDGCYDGLKYGDLEVPIEIGESNTIDSIGIRKDTYDMVLKLYEIFPDFGVFEENDLWDAMHIFEEIPYEYLYERAKAWEKSLLNYKETGELVPPQEYKA